MKEQIKFDFSKSVSIIGNATSGKSILSNSLSSSLSNCVLVKNDLIVNKPLKEYMGIDLSKNIYLQKILNAISTKPKYLILDDVMCFLSDEEKQLVLIECLNEKIIVINFTTNSEELLFFPYMIVINNQQVIMEGNKEEVLNEQKIFNKLGIELPFIVALSHDLKDYGLINELYTDECDLVEALWK